MILLVAMLGGFRARKGDGEPGVKTIWTSQQGLNTRGIQTLPTNPLGQALSHLAGCIHLRHRRREGFAAGLAAQARHVEVNRYAFAVGWKVADEQRFLGVSHGFVGTPAVWAELGNDGRLCLHMVVGIGFLEVENPQAREIEDVDGHAGLWPKGANCILEYALDK